MLSVADGVALFVGIVVGSGIFAAPAAVLGAAPSLGGALALWAAGGFVTLCGSLCYAECAARLPRTGGFYAFYHEAFGEAVAFAGGWIALFVTYPASVAAIAVIFASYLADAIGPERAPSAAVAGTAVIVVASALNVYRVRSGAIAQRILTTAKVLAIAGLCVAAWFAGRPAAAAAEALVATGFWLGPALLLAGTAVLWTYDGWSDVTLVSGELKDPARSVGRTVLYGTIVLVALYSLVQVSVSLLLPPGVAAASPRVFADAVEAAFGSGASRVVALLVVVTTFGSVNAIVITISRLGFAMARDGSFFRWFGGIHPRWGSPARATLAVGAASVFYVWAAKFQALLNYFSFCVWIFYALGAVALLVFRRRGIGENREGVRNWGWLPPVTILVTALAMTIGQLSQNPTEACYGLAMLAASFASYFVWRALRRRQGKRV